MKYRYLINLLIVFIILAGFLLYPFPLSADDPAGKLTGSLSLTMGEKTRHRQLQMQGEDLNNVKAFVYMNSQPDAVQIAEMSAAGITVYPDSWIPPVGEHQQGFVLATVPLDKVVNLASRTYVVKVDSAERQNNPANDVAAETLGASFYWNAGLNGSGVRVAVIDNGLDTTHPDIPAPVYARDYWEYPIIGDNVTSPIAPGGSAHGTHVAGSVLGRGTLSGGRYKGIAYGAELVFIKIGDNITGGASDAAMIGALKDAVDRYGADIISMSYGGWSAHHDGTDANCQAADYAFSKGASVIISAGNEANKEYHCSGTLAASSTSDYIRINVTGSNGSNCALMTNLVWYDGPGVHRDLTLKYYDAARVEIPTQNTSRQESTRGTEQMWYWWGPDPDVSNIFFVPAGDHTYYVRVTNASTSSQMFHLYYNKNYCRNTADAVFASPDIYYTLGSPGEADSTICIGSYTSRYSWNDYTGAPRNYGETVGAVSSFSSRGPRVDTGAPVKPDNVAPGSAIISCRDSSYLPDNYVVSNTGASGLPANYMAMQGTSMATPIAAGSAAVLMQAYPGLKGKPALVKNVLRSYSSKSTTPDYNWGYGLISLRAILSAWPRVAMVTDTYGQSISFAVDSGTIRNLRPVNMQNIQTNGLPPNCSFPFGLFSFEIDELEDGETVNVTITMPQSGATQFWELKGNRWIQIPVLSATGNTMIIGLTDGAECDADGFADGDIQDPGGPAVLMSSRRAQTPPSSSAPVAAAVTPGPVQLSNIKVRSATLSSATILPGEEISVTAQVSNDGTANGTARVKLYVNGFEESSQGISLAAGKDTSVQFTLSYNQPGTYQVQVNNVQAGVLSVTDRVYADVVLIVSLVMVCGSLAGIFLIMHSRRRHSL